MMEGDPAIRWQVMRDLTGAPAAEVARERARVAVEGWGAYLLAMQLPDGTWPVPPPVEPRWKSTLEALWLLRECGGVPSDARVREAVERTATRFTWGEEFGDLPFFEGEVEPCINGRVLALGAYFGHPSAQLLQRLLSEQLADGGWNCEAPRSSTRSSFNTTLCVLEGLLAYERALESAGAAPLPVIREARRRGEEYLLERRLFRSRRTGAVICDEWWQLAFPNDWHYDVLWALDYLVRAGHPLDDPRLDEALQNLRAQRDASGRWPLGHVHERDLPFAPETEAGAPSRWVTLRALRVLAC